MISQMIEQHLTFQAILMAIIVNLAVEFIKDCVDHYAKGKKIPLRKQGLFASTFVMGAGLAWVGCYVKLLDCSSDPIFVVGAWYGVLAVLMYAIGLKEILTAVKGIIKKWLGGEK